MKCRYFSVKTFANVNNFILKILTKIQMTSTNETLIKKIFLWQFSSFKLGFHEWILIF